MRRRTTVALCAAAAFAGACGGIAHSVGDTANDALTQIDGNSNKTRPFVAPWPSVEFKNYTAAQKLYASPDTIIWCTAFPQSSTAPIVTVPIQGKLTSSSVSFFPSSRVKYDNDGGGQYTPERRSVDGMYHGTPPPYRYGFTPGGQYVDFFNVQTICTTKPMSFQRKSISVSVDAQLAGADSQAEQALRRGDHAAADQILKAAAGG